MKLRHKFGLLALLYVVTLAVNVSLCSWCLLLYYESFMSHSAAEPLMPRPRPAPEYPAAEPASPYDLMESAAPGAGEETVLSDQGDILRILAGNALCGIAVAFLGLKLVRQWVMQPVAALRDAAVQIGKGDLTYRVRTASGDELGELAEEVNNMAGSILVMQGQLVEQERRQVAAQALRCIVHNIRSPLTGIRWLAEAIGMRSDVDAQTRREQGRIVELVDGLLSWLGRFRESLAAISVQLAETDVSDLLDAAVRACRDSAEQREISLELDKSSDLPSVRVDRSQFLPALGVVLRDTVRRTPRGGQVRISIGRPKETRGYWHVTIEPVLSTVLRQPAGLPPPARIKPAQSGAPTAVQLGGSGIVETSGEAAGDLAMADRVIRLHGGRMESVSQSPGMFRRTLLMPG